MGNFMVYNLSSGAGDCLALLGPIDQVVTEENAVIRRGTPGVRTASLVRTSVCNERVNWPKAEVEAGGQSALHVAGCA
jgi:hypothetical protein